MQMHNTLHSTARELTASELQAVAGGTSTEWATATGTSVALVTAAGVAASPLIAGALAAGAIVSAGAAIVYALTDEN